MASGIKWHLFGSQCITTENIIILIVFQLLRLNENVISSTSDFVFAYLILPTTGTSTSGQGAMTPEILSGPYFGPHLS